MLKQKKTKKKKKISVEENKEKKKKKKKKKKKDFRGGEQTNESIDQFFVALPYGGAPNEELKASLF